MIEFQDLWADDLRLMSPDTDWLWPGYLAAGSVTLLTSPAKSGKTTLLSVLLKRMETGGELAGQSIQPGIAYIVSEESASQWHLRDQKLQFGHNICWQHRPFSGRKPDADEWDALIDHILGHRRRYGTALAVIDPIANFLPAKSESDSNCIMKALLPLERLTAAGLAVLLLHHPRKQSAAAGQWARGSSALVGFADIIIEMHFYAPGQPDDRRRTLVAASRFDATPARHVIELSGDAASYRSLGNLEEAEFHAGWDTLGPVLAAASRKLTRREIQSAWPKGTRRPPNSTLWRWLDHATARNLVSRDGQGTRRSPHRYWHAEAMARWQRDGSAEYAKQKEDDEWQETLTGWWSTEKEEAPKRATVSDA